MTPRSVRAQPMASPTRAAASWAKDSAPSPWMVNPLVGPTPNKQQHMEADQESCDTPAAKPQKTVAHIVATDSLACFLASPAPAYSKPAAEAGTGAPTPAFPSARKQVSNSQVAGGVVLVDAGNGNSNGSRSSRSHRRSKTREKDLEIYCNPL